MSQCPEVPMKAHEYDGLPWGDQNAREGSKQRSTRISDIPIETNAVAATNPARSSHIEEMDTWVRSPPVALPADRLRIETAFSASGLLIQHIQ